MINKRFFHFFPLLLILFLFACEQDKKDDSPSIDLVRYDVLLMELDTLNIRDALTELESQHPVFSQLYFSEVLPIPGYATKNDTFYENLLGFIKDERIQQVYEMVQDHFADFDDQISDLSKAFDRAQNWLPGTKAPRIYTFISEFSYQGFIFEDGDHEGLAIGLDLFLDEVFDYRSLESGTNSFSQYLTRTYNKDHLVKKTVETWVEDKMGIIKGDRLVDHMVFNGTKLFMLEEILEVHDSVLTEYPAEKLDWLAKNEKEMWSFYFQNDWFYTTDQYVIKRLVNPAPNSVALKMPAAAPGQTGNYLGWKIMKSYMKRFPESSIKEILSQDAQKVLESSKYKPED